jgi:hypothetical protein
VDGISSTLRGNPNDFFSMIHDPIDILSNSPDSPIRPPDWRTRLLDLVRSAPAEYRLEVLRSAGTDAPFVFLAWEQCGVTSRIVTGFHIANRSWGDSRQTYGLGMDDAVAFHSLPEAWAKAILESWLLTGLNDDEIASRTGLSAPLIRWYERLYFHCRDRLGCQSYVHHFLTNEFAFTPKPEDVLRQMAYGFGPEWLEFTLQNWDGTTRFVFDRRSILSKSSPDRKRLHALRLMILTRLLPVSKRSTLRQCRELNGLRRKQAEYQTLVNHTQKPLWSPEEILDEQRRIHQAGAQEPKHRKTGRARSHFPKLWDCGARKPRNKSA